MPIISDAPADRGSGGISRIFLWANSGCNARCATCAIWRESPGRVLPASFVARIASEWAGLGVTRVILCGEPLLHPEFVRVCSAVRDCGLKLDVLTNGLLLRRRAWQVVESCDVLQVSIDGPPRVHNQVRGHPAAFERLRAGVQHLHEIAPGFPVDARCAVHRLNFRHLRETVAAAKALGLRSIGFSGTDLLNEEAFRRTGLLTPSSVEALLIRDDEIDALEAEYEGLTNDHADDFASGFIADSPEDLRRMIVEYYRGITGRGALPTPVCNAPWRSAVIDYDGSVRPCFPLPSYGNLIVEGSLRAVWTNERARTLRRTFDVGTAITCRHCVCQTRITDRLSEHWRLNPKAASWSSRVRS